MTMIVAALDLPVAGAEKSNMVRPAEATLLPTRVDHPGTTAGNHTSCTSCTACPSTATGMHCATTLDEAAPGCSAAAHLCELVAKSANTMS